MDWSKNSRKTIFDLSGARGPGLSDKPHDPQDYDLKLRVNDILAVIDDLGVDKPIIWVTQWVAV
ncbi:MAG: hypothetical protein CM1200mP27_08120 [Chloroflexota bacterium]|nr:MAG: hypothetical protein CM1200mP27_08120 [Chloroflexota bacterium]